VVRIQKTSIEWGQLHKAIKKNPNLPVEEYSKLTGSMVFNPAKGTNKFSITEPLYGFRNWNRLYDDF